MTAGAEEELCRRSTMDTQVVATQGAKRAEGWLFLIAERRLRGQFPQKRYFIVERGVAACFKMKPTDRDEVPLRKGVIDPDTRVIDNGRETIHGQVLFVFTISDSGENENQLKFGARSAEEAAKWMTAFKLAAKQAEPRGKSGAFVPSHGKRRLNFSWRRGGSGSGLDHFHGEDTAAVPDWSGAVAPKDGSPDVVSASPWRIIGCKNGLRLFRETTDSHGGFRSMIFREDQPALMSVGVVDADCEAIFQTAMALGPSRHEWDFCYLRGKVLEHIDGHTDIIHKMFHNSWHNGSKKSRDLVLLRYWRREEDGSYVILYRSVKHEKCPPRRGFVRATLKSGGYLISPLDSPGQQRRALVHHMITADWKVWQTCFQSGSEQDVTLWVLERVAALRELYKTKTGGSLAPRTASKAQGIGKGLKVSRSSDSLVNICEQERRVGELPYTPKSPEASESPESPTSRDSLFLQLGDGDEFYDVQEDPTWWDADADVERQLKNRTEAEGSFEDEKAPKTPKLSAAITFKKRLHDLAAQVKNQKTEPGVTDEIDIDSLSKEGTLPKCSESVVRSCWDTADVDTFLVRGKTYLRDNRKIKAGEPWMHFIAADWLKSDKREDHLASRPNNVIQVLTSKFQKSSTKGNSPFFFIINMQVPGATTHSLAIYYMTSGRLQDDPLLESFVHGDDRHRNARFKLIPHIAKGSWIVKQSVGKTACLLGQALTINYHTGSNYIELDVDIGSSSVARGVVNLVVGYLSNLVIDMSFLIQADTEEELPEHLLGTCRLNNLEINKASAVPAY